MTLQQQLESGMSHHQAGRWAEAEAVYRQILSQNPNHPEALNLLGTLAAQMGQLDAAVELMRQAIRFKPDYPDAHYNLAIVLQNKGQLDEAIVSYRNAIRLKPDYTEAHGNLGNALRDKGQLDEAIAAYQHAIGLKPDYAEAYYNLALALKDHGQPQEAIAANRQAIRFKPDLAEAHNNLGVLFEIMERFDEAIAFCRRAIGLKPDYAEAHYNLGVALELKRLPVEAIAAYRQALRLKPDYAEAHGNLGNALKDIGQLPEAIAAYRQAVRLKPDCAETYGNLGNALKDLGQIDEAIAVCRHAIQLKPDLVEAHNNLASALRDKGQLDEAIASLRQAMRLKPDSEWPHSNLIYTLHYHPSYDARMIHDELRRWNQQHAEPLRKFIQPHANDRNPDRPLRIGYVSPDFHEHPVARFLLPLLAGHDPDRFEVFCYADVQRPDRFTELLRRHAQQWRNIVGLPDERLAQLIRDDKIDVLVDLALHTATKGLMVFARKPAPVQVTYLAYAGSSGLATMDYRLSDPYLDPPGGDESVYSERTVRLPETYWCYQPVVDPPLQPPPALEKGFITFGCLNNFCKINEPLLSLWAEILRGVPQSRLLLHAYEGSPRQHVLEHLQRQGIDPQRVSFVGRQRLAVYLQRYHTIDIALDTFPFGGGTTTCDTLWMGVPVVSLAGRTAVGRTGLSILSNVGLPELVANTPEEYVRLAVRLGNDLPRLKDLRSTLRPRMQASPLMDAPRFARNVEAAYRLMWRNWCQHSGGSK